jgi:DNA-binding transcriptional MerR regulator
VKGPVAQSAPELPSSEIPDKLYFRIGEVSRLAGVEPYVLRYWQTEFPAIAPKKSGTGHRLFRRKDVEAVLEIKRLLYEKRFTIEGARKALNTKSTGTPAKSPGRKSSQGDLFPPASPDLSGVRSELAAILDLLK